MKRLSVFFLISCSTAFIGAQEINSLGMKMLPIKPGAFLMGSQENETILTCDTWDERPVHEVRIRKTFFMSENEVTNAQYEQFDPSHRKWRGLRGVSQEDNEVVNYISWYEAAAFCKWLSEKEGKPYRQLEQIPGFE